MKKNSKAARRKKKNKAVASFSADYRSETQAPIREEEQDIEIDDFLPEGETHPQDELLTKWEDELPEEEKPAELPPEELPEEPPALQPSAREPASGRELRPRGKRWYGVLVGSLVLVLALVGVCSIAGLVGSRIYQAATDDSALRAYDSFLDSVVMQDPEPFSSPEEADPLFIQNAALWKTILDDNGAALNSYDDAGRAVIPLGVVASAGRELFGPDCPFSPSNPSEETFYTYDSTDNTYHVSLFSTESAITPYTESSKRSGDSTILKVGYVAPTDEWRNQGAVSGSSGVSRPTPTKYMEYVMKTNPETGAEYLYAVQPLSEEG